jgi:hypothetical protein
VRSAHAGKKHVSFEPSVYKNGFLPRQARDKHGKTQKDYRFVLQGSCAYRRNLTVAASSDGGASWSIEPWGLIYKGRAVRKRHSLSHFLDHFAKTGSGHTQRNAEQRWKRYVSRMQAYSNLVELPNGNIAVVFERSNSSLDEYRYVSVAIVTPTW